MTRRRHHAQEGAARHTPEASVKAGQPPEVGDVAASAVDPSQGHLQVAARWPCGGPAPDRHGFQLRLPDDAATRTLGHRLGSRLRALGGRLGLVGDLGAGKTALTRGMVEGFDAAWAGQVRSPTYAIAQAYGPDEVFWHLDLYRLSGDLELDGIGLEDIEAAAYVLVVEWVDRAPGFAATMDVVVRLGHAPGGGRAVEGRAQTPHGEALLDALSLAGFYG